MICCVESYADNYNHITMNRMQTSKFSFESSNTLHIVCMNWINFIHNGDILLIHLLV